MTGVLFQLDPDCATFVATDARLVRYQRNEIKSQNPQHLLCQKALNLLKTLCLMTTQILAKA